MPRKSSIKQLPPPIKTEIDRLLSDGRTTIDEIVAHLQKLGVTVSRSAVGRYSQRFEDVSRKMREAREISTAFAKELGDFKNDEVGRQITEMLRTVIFNVLLPRVSDEEPTVEPADLMFMAKAICPARTKCRRTWNCVFARKPRSKPSRTRSKPWLRQAKRTDCPKKYWTR